MLGFLDRIGGKVRWVVWIAYTAAWTVALLTPQPVHVAAAILPKDTGFYYSKALHIAAYAGLVVLTAWLRVTPRVRWLLLLFVSAHGFATEYLQNFVPERVASWRDVGIDHVGIVLGMILSAESWLAREKVDAKSKS